MAKEEELVRVTIFTDTTDQSKIFNNFHLFHGYMTTISKILKEENHRLFSEDLQKRLADLRLTAATLAESKSGYLASKINKKIKERKIYFFF